MEKRPWTTLKRPAEIKELFRTGQRLQTKGLYCRFLLLQPEIILQHGNKAPVDRQEPIKLLLGAQAKGKHQVSKNRTKRILRAHINELQQKQGLVSRLKQGLGQLNTGLHLAIIGSEHFSHQDPAERTARLQHLLAQVNERIRQTNKT
jgi:RNase P protein component